MAIHSIVLEKPVGSNAEGSVIQCDEELAANLISAGVAREATEEDVSGAEGPDEETESEDNPDEMTDAVRRLAASAEDTVTKAVAGVAEKLAKASVKAPQVPANRHVGGSDYTRTGGFKNLGDATQTWMAAKNGDFGAAKKFSKYTEALRTKATGMSITGGSGHQGGDLVPQEWADQLWKLSFANVPDLLGMMTKYEMRNQIENIPAWVQSSAATGVTASVIAEASDITATVGVTANVQLSLKKGAALVNVSDELLRFNAYNLTTVLEQIVPERIRFLVNDSVVNGTNSGVNLVSNAAAVSVIAANPGRIEYNDITKMEAALFDEFDGENTVWLCNKSTLPELYSLSFPNRAASTPIPAWTPGGFSDMLGPKPKGTLLGRPVFTLENCPGLGSRGALLLANLKSLAAGYSGLIADETPYLYFNLAQSTLRFLFYFNSVNPLTTKYTRADGSFASNLVVLTAGSTSSS